ncbi:hypothetical protein ACVWZZ_004604 [Bradyrhizobium sp. LM6.10]
MSVTLAAFGEGAAVCFISESVKELAWRPVPGDPVTLQITKMGPQRPGRAHSANHPRLDHGAARPVVEQSGCRKTRGASTSEVCSTAVPA